MCFSIKGLLYRVFIDPLIGSLRRRVTSMISPGERVIEVACGTGALSLSMATIAGHVTGLDLSEDMILTARQAAGRRRAKNVAFELRDATDLSGYQDKVFDAAVSTMAMHQFDPGTGVKVLLGMRRVAGRIIIADYSCPMRPGPAAWLSRTIERAAGGEHYRNFRTYMERGGLGRLAEEAGLKIISQEEKGEGVFTVAVLMPAAAKT